MLIIGKCHCGNIAFTLDWPDDQSVIPARACNCSFCIRHGGVWTSNPRAKLSVELQRPDLVSKYAFGTETASFHVCTRCGTVPLVTSEIADHLYAVARLKNMQRRRGLIVWITEMADSAGRPELVTAAFDGEDVDSRLTRRCKNWIADVQWHRSASEGPHDGR